jgi:DNA-binding CsgD family transcriptional regulator
VFPCGRVLTFCACVRSLTSYGGVEVAALARMARRVGYCIGPGVIRAVPASLKRWNVVADRIVGRDSELASIDDFIQHPGSDRALVLRGEPGIGKTTLWNAGVARAAEQGHEVRTTRPTQSEAKLSYVGLGDLLEDLADEAFAELPGPQQLALDVALLRAEAPEGGLDHRTVCVAVLAALRSITASAPLLVAIDDVQWLDGATAEVLAFVARRLGDVPVRFLTSLRAGPRAADPLNLVRNLGEDEVRVIDVAGLSLDALHALVRARLGTSIPRPTLARVLDASGGNAFFTLEIARAISDGRVQLAPGRSIDLPRNLAELVPGRVAELPSSTRDVLLLCSAASTPTTALLRSAAADPDRVSSDLASAVRVGVVELERERIRFTHPLLSSAVYSDATAERRREAHGQLAEVVEDREERARHAALAAEGPDAGVAVELEAAARLARQRGALGAAADLCMLAADLTPTPNASEIRRLQLLAADDLLLAGDAERSRAIARSVVETAPPGPERAEALLREGRASFFVGHHENAQQELGRALLEPGVGPERLSTIHRERAWALWQHDLLAAERDAEEAVRLAEAATDPTLVAAALHILIVVRTMLGSAVPDDVMAEALEVDEAADPLFVFDRPKGIFAVRRALTGQLDEARGILLELLDESTVRGDEASAGDILGRLGWVEHLAGNWGSSLAYHERAVDLLTSPDPLLGLAPVQASVGHIDRAADEARKALEYSALAQDVEWGINARAVLGFIHLSRGDPGRAHEYLQAAWEMHQRWGFGEPGPWFLFVADHVEVLVEIGRPVEAGEVLDWLEERGRALDRPWSLAVAARYRGLLAAARGDLPAALTSLDEALRYHERLPMPFELARTLLLQGSVRRRARQKRAARESLDRALEIFERLPAPLWADKARSELARVSGRQPMTGELSPVERRVARLAAAGRTNKEIADALYLSARTVAGHLSHVYGKLGVRSRTELGLFDELMQDTNAHS